MREEEDIEYRLRAAGRKPDGERIRNENDTCENWSVLNLKNKLCFGVHNRPISQRRAVTKIGTLR